MTARDQHGVVAAVGGAAADADAPSPPPGVVAPGEMIVVSHLEWVWRDMVAGVAGRWPVRRSRGDDVPEVRSPATAWWVATAHAARLSRHGVALELECVPPGWVAGLDRQLTGRRVVAATVDDVLASPRDVPASGFVKPAVAKLDALPGAWCDDVAAAVADAAARGVRGGTVLEVCGDWLDVAAEYRSFVVDGDAARPSPYRLGEATWEPGFDERADARVGDAHRFAAEAAAQLHRDGRVPRAWVLDVARLADGGFVVVEANAPWASGTYGCELGRVADAAAVASTPPADPRWRWRPDPSEDAAAAALPPLRRGGESRR